MAVTPYEKALAAIDRAHEDDPTLVNIDNRMVPYELHYAQKSTYYLGKHAPDASDVLRLAIRAQHFRRWEVPRNTYPMTKAGYYAWRTGLKKRQAEQTAEICIQSGFSSDDASRVAALIRKENIKSDDETQILEDVACLVFLDDQFEQFEKEHDEPKIVNILRKTWVKMSERGHQLALEISMSSNAKLLVSKALTA